MWKTFICLHIRKDRITVTYMCLFFIYFYSTSAFIFVGFCSLLLFFFFLIAYNMATFWFCLSTNRRGEEEWSLKTNICFSRSGKTKKIEKKQKFSFNFTFSVPLFQTYSLSYNIFYKQRVKVQSKQNCRNLKLWVKNERCCTAKWLPKERLENLLGKTNVHYVTLVQGPWLFYRQQY